MTIQQIWPLATLFSVRLPWWYIYPLHPNLWFNMELMMISNGSMSVPSWSMCSSLFPHGTWLFMGKNPWCIWNVTASHVCSHGNCPGLFHVHRVPALLAHVLIGYALNPWTTQFHTLPGAETTGFDKGGNAQCHHWRFTVVNQIVLASVYQS